MLASLVPIAPDSPFPLENLPLGVFRRSSGAITVGTALGDQAVDLAELARRGAFVADGRLAETLLAGAQAGALNPLMAAGGEVRRTLRQRLQRLFSTELRDQAGVLAATLEPLAGVELMLPAVIGDYTDFYSSKHHAFNVGSMMRGPEQALQPNWVELPVGYHGRAGTVVVSGTPIRRPRGQTMKDGDARPTFGPSRRLDIELETGCFIAGETRLGETVPMAGARERIFGYALLNDWSARDIQKWEYVPLGPFLAKNFATSVSGWVVTPEALAPFEVPGEPQQPEPLEYLREPGPRGYDVTLELWLKPAGASEAVRIIESNMRHLYWSPRQQLVHHASNGCRLRSGDLLGSGTISGPEKSSRGCLLELTWGGREPVTLPDGSTRTFLEDGDEVILTGFTKGPDYRIGFGECRGTILPA
jgi:fumarylacetoacetase